MDNYCERLFVVVSEGATYGSQATDTVSKEHVSRALARILLASLGCTSRRPLL